MKRTCVYEESSGEVIETHTWKFSDYPLYRLSTVRVGGENDLNIVYNFVILIMRIGMYLCFAIRLVWVLVEARRGQEDGVTKVTGGCELPSVAAVPGTQVCIKPVRTQKWWSTPSATDKVTFLGLLVSLTNFMTCWENAAILDSKHFPLLIPRKLTCWPAYPGSLQNVLGCWY